VTQEQVESQLSAMFDGELPAAECELLSRRIDRDENLRSRWSRYALIGAAMRSEPVATARRGFAGRVSAALDAGDGMDAGDGRREEQRTRRVKSAGRKRTVWNTALAASMVAAVAGVSISLLRYSSPYAGGGAVASHVSTPATVGAAGVATDFRVNAAAAAMPVAIRFTSGKGSGEPRSYTTPINQPNTGVRLRTELADLIVAHSEYSTPLMRRSLLSALVSNEDPSLVDAGQIDVLPAASPANH
jgi:sigma-E factor negative regulatory protein RseA